MDYSTGDRCIGAHGTELTRTADGWWRTPSGFGLCRDETITWALGLDIKYPPPPEPKERKLSKTEPIQPPVFQYKWKLIRA